MRWEERSPPRMRPEGFCTSLNLMGRVLHASDAKPIRFRHEPDWAGADTAHRVLETHPPNHTKSNLEKPPFNHDIGILASGKLDRR